MSDCEPEIIATVVVVDLGTDCNVETFLCAFSAHFMVAQKKSFRQTPPARRSQARRSGVISSSVARNYRSVSLTNNVKPTGHLNPRTLGMGLFCLSRRCLAKRFF
ncbi:hypothetical protein L596_012675 [Steinernema carpocapsae]|uniref:Uncharacterized protein n=1 Tax=Steinernema carpocapsae TaxID=34508 RepID=A0A4U5NYN1_STECR|nr:hypothetical protein L596_012675 [Steinernema carpocapsae]